MDEECRKVIEELLHQVDDIQRRLDEVKSILNNLLSEKEGEGAFAFESLKNIGEEEEEEAGRLSTLDLIELPPLLRNVMTDIMRHPSTGVDEIADRLGREPEEIKEVVDVLINKGYVEEENGKYRARLKKKRASRVPLNIWEALEKKI